jgi:ABC-type nitrate/sulfonate/bicarbonate transport system permease component
MRSAVPVLRATGGFVAFLLLWEGAVRGGLLHYDYLPAPSAVAVALSELALAGDAFGETAHTLGAALAAWAIAVSVGVVCGAVLGVSATVRTYTMATVELIRPLPPVALVPVALLLFGFSIKTEIIVTALPAVFPVLIGTMGGVMAVPSGLRDLGGSLEDRAAGGGAIGSRRLPIEHVDVARPRGRGRDDRKPARAWLCDCA